MEVDVRCGTDLFHELLLDRTIVPWLEKLDAHNHELLQHSVLAGAVASEFCRFVPLSVKEQRQLITGSLLHDVGKLSIAVEILQKSTPLTFIERKKLELHPAMGVELLKNDGWPAEVLEMVLLHHERMDGSGYPHGLSGNRICMAVRMLMICDVFSALIERRSYRPSPRQPIEIMRVMSTEFDESLLGVFSRDVSQLGYRALDLLNVVEVP